MDDLISRSELIAQLEGFKLSQGDVILRFVVDRVIERVEEMPASESRTLATENRILIYFDELVAALAREYSQTMDTHIYSPREILSSIQGVNPANAVDLSEYEAIVYKLECLLCHATGGRFSKASYSFKDMECMVTDYIEECCQAAIDEQVVPCKKCNYYAFGRCKFWNAEIHPDNFCSFSERRSP